MHRHQYKGRKLSRKAGPRKALVRNLISQVILHEKVTTTLEKAKEIKPTLEKLITKAKSGTLADRRIVAKTLSNNDLALTKLFEELGPLYKERNGGYTRIIKLGTRKGDGATMAQISLLDTELLTKKVMADSKQKKNSNKPEKTEIKKTDQTKKTVKTTKSTEKKSVKEKK